MNEIQDSQCKWIQKERKEVYSPWNLFYELILIIPAFLIGIYILAWIPGIGILLSIIYGFWTFGCYFIVFRIVLCPNCYYYGRWCPDGMGKFAKKVYGVKGDINRYKKALTIPTVGWVVIVVFPIIVSILSYFNDPNLTIPLFFKVLKLQVPILIFTVIFAVIFFIYFTMHKFLSCKGCAHVKSCNLSKVALPQLFLGIISGIIVLYIVGVFIL